MGQVRCKRKSLLHVNCKNVHMKNNSFLLHDNIPHSLRHCQSQLSILSHIKQEYQESLFQEKFTASKKEYPCHQKQLQVQNIMHGIALKLYSYSYLLMKKSLKCYIQVQSPQCQVTQYNQKAPIPVSLYPQVD